jgi:hypothetical protein
MGLNAKDRKQKYEKICEVKVATILESLYGAYPPEFLSFLRQVRSLWFDEVPVYGLYRQWFCESDFQSKKHFDPRIWTLLGIKIDSNDELKNVSDSIRVKHEFNSNKINKKDF